MPRSYKDKDMVGGFEMIYRFSLDPKNYYCNPDVFIELEKGKTEGFTGGCTNTDGKGNTTRGTSYYQSHLKKLRNTLDERNCTDIIRGNVCNPEDFFRQANEKRHTSTESDLSDFDSYPGVYTSWMIWLSTSGVVSEILWLLSLLLGRKYVGIELENNYYQQSCRRVDETEKRLRIDSDGDLSKAA